MASLPSPNAERKRAAARKSALLAEIINTASEEMMTEEYNAALEKMSVEELENEAQNLKNPDAKKAKGESAEDVARKMAIEAAKAAKAADKRGGTGGGKQGAKGGDGASGSGDKGGKKTTSGDTLPSGDRTAAAAADVDLAKAALDALPKPADKMEGTEESLSAHEAPKPDLATKTVEERFTKLVKMALTARRHHQATGDVSEYLSTLLTPKGKALGLDEEQIEIAIAAAISSEKK